MLPKKNRLDTKTVERVFKMGNFVVSRSLSLKFIKNTNNNPPRVSFVAPKSLAKTAVSRNALRRMGYHAVSPAIKNLPIGFTGVFVFKNKTITKEDLSQDLNLLLKKI